VASLAFSVALAVESAAVGCPVTTAVLSLFLATVPTSSRLLQPVRASEASSTLTALRVRVCLFMGSLLFMRRRQATGSIDRQAGRCRISSGTFLGLLNHRSAFFPFHPA